MVIQEPTQYIKDVYVQMVSLMRFEFTERTFFIFLCSLFYLEAEENDRIKLNIEFVQCFLPY